MCIRDSNSIKYRKSPPVWACIADKIRDGWEAACNVSGYVPFRIFDGIKGYENTSEKIKTSGYTVYQPGLHIGSWGLSINVDSPVAGYNGNGDPVYSVFTGMWTPKFVEQHTDELYELGVLYFDPRGTVSAAAREMFGAFSDAGSKYKDNAYQGFFERDRRQAQTWKDAEDSYWTSAREEDYDKVMKSAHGSEIVGIDVDPVLWVLTFCERTGMKWGNSFFLRKRFRGPKTGITILGIDTSLWAPSGNSDAALLANAPVGWNIEEQKRISAIYGIEDIVARINAISFPQTSYDAHMHFQYFSGPGIIPWEDLGTT